MPQTPTDPTKAQVWVTGTAPNQQLEFYIPRGAKGEPGGFNAGTVLGTANLNEIVTPGLYKQDNSANVTVLRNYPKDSVSGALKVYDRVAPGSFASVFQEWTPAVSSVSGSPSLFIRYSYNNHASWSPWRAFNSTRVDQTAGRAIYQWDDLNNREQRIYGDTGWRDVSADLVNGATVTSTLKIRRQNDTVSLQIVNLKLPSTAIGDPWYLIPTGFQGVQTFGFMRETVNTGQAFGFSTTTHAMLYGTITAGANNTTHRFTGALNWHTEQAWPTTLPGIAAGTIQNA